MLTPEIVSNRESEPIPSAKERRRNQRVYPPASFVQEPLDDYGMNFNLILRLPSSVSKASMMARLEQGLLEIKNFQAKEAASSGYVSQEERLRTEKDQAEFFRTMSEDWPEVRKVLWYLQNVFLPGARLLEIPPRQLFRRNQLVLEFKRRNLFKKEFVWPAPPWKKAEDEAKALAAKQKAAA